MHKIGIKTFEDFESLNNKIVVQGITAGISEWRVQNADLFVKYGERGNCKWDPWVYRVFVDGKKQCFVVIIVLDGIRR